MYLYRVQHRRTGVGPYDNPLDIAYQLNVAHSSGAKGRPSPSNDGIDYHKGLRCAMLTLDSLLWWFEGFHSRLDHYGFEIVKVKAPKRAVKIGKTQVMYDPALSTIVKHLPIPVKRRRP